MAAVVTQGRTNCVKSKTDRELEGSKNSGGFWGSGFKSMFAMGKFKRDFRHFKEYMI